MSRRNEILESLKSIELLSSPAIGALQMLNDPDVENDKVGRVIEFDPALTTNVLRFANSAYFGCTQKVENVKSALVRLGMKTVSRMVYMSAASQLSPHQVKGYDLEPGMLWQHLLTTAVCTDLLAKKLGIVPPPAAFTAALLHDIGKLVLGNELSVDVEPILALAAEKDIPFEVAEREILGIDHAEVGAELMKQWSLPDSISDAIRWHLEPEFYEGPNDVLVNLLHLSNITAMIYGTGLGLDGLNYTVNHQTEEQMGINRDIIENVICELGEELEKLEELTG